MDAATAGIYEQIAARWHQTRGEAHDDIGRRFRALAGTGLVADLGCGPGRYLPQVGSPVVAVDVTEAMLSIACHRGYPGVRADVEALPFAERSLAGALARHSYLHIPKTRMVAALAELRRVLQRGGLLMISLIEGDYEGHALPGDDFPGRYFAFWKAPELAGALSSAGFADVNVDYIPRPGNEGDLLATARR
jgi:alkylated DNA repair protein alkB family protein 8